MDIEQIRRLYATGQLNLRYVSHATVEARKEGFNRSDFLEALVYGELIEDYGQSALLLHSKPEGNVPYHVVIDYSAEAATLVFVTIYIPSSDRWAKGWKRRKQKSKKKR